MCKSVKKVTYYIIDHFSDQKKKDKGCQGFPPKTQV